MAEYTIELKDVLATGHKIFDFKYPFYNEEKRPEFEKAFIRHFYFREIGAPTIDRFKLYLEDKMHTVFPFYNELFNAAQIEYSVLDNYKMTEEMTVTRENEGKTAGVSSTVGQFKGTQEGNTKRDGSVVGEGKTVTDGTTTSQNSRTDKPNETTTEKFLDTPQGRVDLSDPDYLTSLKETDRTGTNTTTENGHGSNIQTVDTDSQETTDETIVTTNTDDQKTTQDNNTRTFMDSKQTEKQTLTRVGNIGVDTDSDMIEKHIRLQKTLKQIELMFFNECEDLFMLVY